MSDTTIYSFGALQKCNHFYFTEIIFSHCLSLPLFTTNLPIRIISNRCDTFRVSFNSYYFKFVDDYNVETIYIKRSEYLTITFKSFY